MSTGVAPPHWPRCPPDRALDMHLFLLATTPLLALAIGSLVLLGLPDLEPPARPARRD